MNVNFEFFSVEPATVIGVLINTFILFLILKKYLFAPINKIVEEREKQISNEYEKADAAFKSAKEMESEYSERLEGAGRESAEIMEVAAQRAKLRSDEIIRDAESRASQITSRARERTEYERRLAAEELKGQVSRIAGDIASKIIGREVSSDAEQERLINEFISGLDEK